MRFNDGIQVEEVEACSICHAAGVPRHPGMRDKIFGAAGVWNLSYCRACDLGWLNPRPVPSDIGKAYRNYYTHSISQERRSILSALKRSVQSELLNRRFGYQTVPAATASRLVATVASTLVPMATEVVGFSVMWLAACWKGKLLDVGCGTGEFLEKMKQLGWDVAGVEPDEQAAGVAKERFGLDVSATTLAEARFSSNSFDCITAHQTIEHMHDPIEFLGESLRILKPGGKLIVTTPNISSLGHRVFRRCWRGLEPPRHLFLFSPRALRTCVDRVGFQIEVLRTSARSTWEIWYASRLICRDGKIPSTFPENLDSGLRLEGLAIQLLQHMLLRFNETIGEQIVMIASKPLRPVSVA